MNISTLVWNRLRLVSRLPGAYALFYVIANLIYRNGSVVTIRRGPAAGLRWRHYRCYQPWMALGLYEPEVARLISQSLQPGSVFYDIGANAGYYVLVGARAVGVTGRVIAFDPLPQNVTTIQEQVHLNGLDRICRVEPLAISDTTGTLPFRIARRNANSHLADVGAPHIAHDEGDCVQVLCETLDNYVSEHAWPTLVKMDIEGSEVRALQGASRLLTSPDAPVFLITAHSHALDRQVRAILSAAGYVFSDFKDMVHAIPSRLSGTV